MTKFAVSCVNCGVCIAIAPNKKKALQLAQQRHIPQAENYHPTGLDVFIPLCTLRATEL